MSPRRIYETELKELKGNVEGMGVSVQATYMRLFAALKQKDVQTLEEIAKCDRDVHNMQRKIEGECLNLITKQQPIARDLRQVTASLKATADVSRIGEMCVDIAELLLRMGVKDITDYSAHLPELIEKTKLQVADAVTAFSDCSIRVASRVIEGDDTIDGLFNLVKDDLIAHLKNESKDPDECVDTLMIDKYLEKIGDHAVNIAEWTLFQESGEYKNVRIL